MAGEKEQDLESNSDIEDMRIKPTDNMVLVGHVEGNASILEVYGKLHDFQDLVNPRIVKRFPDSYLYPFKLKNIHAF